MKSNATGLSMDSTIGEIFATPVGHDVIKKLLLQMNVPDLAVTNPVVSKIPLRLLAEKIGDRLDAHFYDTILALCNSERDLPVARTRAVTPQWWKEAVFYQIYPRTFRDANGDGIGDLAGIIEKLDYLQGLGIDAIWLSPIYDSPNDDNGYDIRDYRKIQREFGTMRDFDKLLSELHSRGMRLIMDLVVNHTSDEHKWFKQAIRDPESEYRKYYFIRESGAADGADTDTPPNNWTSFFSGSAWDRYGKDGVWALHLFSKKQPDLNWENPAVRDEVVDMIRFWLDRGVDGFRMDVINYISKESLADGDETIGEMFGFTGIEHYLYGPRLHEYLRELHTRAFAPYGAFSVGETPGVGMEMAKLLSGESRGEIDMIFSFDHLEAPGHERFDDYRYDLNYWRDYMIDWMEHYGNDCWMSVFYDNHDNPRMLSKVNPDPEVRPALSRLLAVMQLTMSGTPFIYQGDEMGLTNYDFRSMEDINDIESKNKYEELVTAGKSPEEAFKVICAGTRDHARGMLPWEDSADGLPEHLRQTADKRVTEVYRRLIRLRKRHNALIYGDFRVISRARDRFTYERFDWRESFVIDCNLSERARRGAFDGKSADYRLVYAPLYGHAEADVMGGYEVRIWKREKV